MGTRKAIETALDPRDKKSLVKSPLRIDAFSAVHPGPSCGVLAPHVGLREFHDDERDAFFSSERTRAALLKLIDDSKDALAIETVWQENAGAIERQMVDFLDSPINPANIERTLGAMAALSKFFCDEFDDPKEWIARCANLEARRFALESKRTN